jgi:hypothetical protein
MYTYFSPIRLIPIFYDLYIMYSQIILLKKLFIIIIIFTIQNSKNKVVVMIAFGTCWFDCTL